MNFSPDSIADYSGWVVGVWAGLTTVVLILRGAKKKAKSAFSKYDAAVDTLVGRPEIRHPDTNVVLVEATPGLGARLAHMEEAIVALSHTQSAMTVLTVRVDSLAAVLTQHIEECSPK